MNTLVNDLLQLFLRYQEVDLRRDTDLKVVIALWEYVKMPEESRQKVLAFLDESEKNNPSGELPPLDYLQSLPVEDINDFDKVMGKIINDIIVEACDLACWVYVCKFIEGLSLEQIVDQNRSAEQFIAALFSMFDKYIDIPDNDSNNIRPS